MSETVDIVIYRITGKQGPIDIPHRYCEECDLTVQLTRGVLDELGDQNIRLDVKPWMLWFWRPIWRGGWHAPILTINGRVFTQGIVPERNALRDAILQAGTRAAVEPGVGHHPNAR